jgi:hypothetical protein
MPRPAELRSNQEGHQEGPPLRKKLAGASVLDAMDTRLPVLYSCEHGWRWGRSEAACFAGPLATGLAMRLLRARFGRREVCRVIGGVTVTNGVSGAGRYAGGEAT